jgi:hypothetical protein
MKGWYWRTSRGVVSIRPVAGRWCIFFNDENLGSYHSPDAAAGGHTFTPSNGVDLGSIGLSDNINDWERL